MKAAELISRQLLETWKHQYCTEENPKDDTTVARQPCRGRSRSARSEDNSEKV